MSADLGGASAGVLQGSGPPKDGGGVGDAGDLGVSDAADWRFRWWCPLLPTAWGRTSVRLLPPVSLTFPREAGNGRDGPVDWTGLGIADGSLCLPRVRGGGVVSCFFGVVW